MKLKNFTVISFAAALTGCSLFQPEPGFNPSLPQKAETAATAPESISPSTVSETIPHTVDNSNVADLWNQAENARKLGDYTAAESFLEKALQETPSDPVLLSRMAELQLRLDQYAKAENMAAKSTAVAQSNPQLMYRNWLIVEYARNKRGDLLGAQEARREAALYRP